MVLVLIVVLGAAALGAYEALSSSSHSSSPSSSSSSTSSNSGSPPQVTVLPQTPLISPGQTQNYTILELQPPATSPEETVTLKAFSPPGLSLVPAQSSVSLSSITQNVAIQIKADSGLASGRYRVTIEVGSGAAENTTFTVQVVPELVLMQDVGFHPQNISVSKGTTVTWINLDSMIGCCDPGNHDVSFLSGPNATSPILKRYDSWNFTFGTDAVVDYYCTIHPYMKGQVTVTG